jgi:uncharacterized protein (TIGR02231 family)
MRQLALVFMLFGSSAAAAEIDAPSRIDTVVVHPDAAVITRLAEVDLPAGASTVLVRGLPAGIDPASVRVEGSADAPLTILGLDVRTVPGDTQPVIDAPLEAKLKELRDQREALSGRIEALESKKATIGRYATASPEKLSPEAKPLDVSQWATAWDAIGEALTRVNEELRIQRSRARDLDAEIAALERARPQPARPGAPKRDIAVALEAGTAAKGALQLTYRVSGAGWAPLYDARLSTGTATARPSLTLVRRASIRQRTGEDWREVQLSVSTVSTSRGTAAPDLPPLLVSLFEPSAQGVARQIEGLRAREGRDTQAYKGANEAHLSAAARAPETKPAEEQGTRIEATGFTVAFSVPGRVSIPADGSTKTLLISSRAFEPVLAVQTVPALDPAGYLVAREECCLAGAEVCLEARPADGGDKLHEGVFDVDSLVEPGAEEVGLSAVAAFFGSHAHPRLHADGVWNHARARGSICRKRHLQPAQTGEYEYLPRAKTHVRAKACEFFTDD